MVPARCKLAYIRAGIIAIIGSAATGLISVEKVSNNSDEDSRIQEDVPADLPPHRTIVRAPRASKISTDYKCFIILSTNLHPRHLTVTAVRKIVEQCYMVLHYATVCYKIGL